MRFVNRLGDKWRGLAHRRQKQHVDLFEGVPNLAAGLANSLQRLYVSLGGGVFRSVQQSPGPGMIVFGSGFEKLTMVMIQLDVSSAALHVFRQRKSDLADLAHVPAEKIDRVLDPGGDVRVQCFEEGFPRDTDSETGNGFPETAYIIGHWTVEHNRVL